MLSLLLVTGKLRAVTGDVHIHFLKTVRINPYPDGKPLSVHSGLTFLKNCPELFLNAELIRHCSEMVTAVTAHPVVTELPQQNIGKTNDQPVTLLKTILPVIMPESDNAAPEQAYCCSVPGPG